MFNIQFFSRLLGLLLIASLVQANEFWDENSNLPEVLTATRLKQPRVETPASMTVIEAEQIEAWGARSIPEVLRFVPGMFVGASQKETTDTVVYHASTQNIMRRLQVLVDGRSVYKAAIARVIWDDIPVAVEDIQRIEVIRGPSSATYGSNAFMATINIITKVPADTLGTRVRYRNGNQGVDDRLISHSGELGQGAFRVTASYQSDNGFDGPDAKNGHDEWADGRRNQFVSLAFQQQLTNRTNVHVDMAAMDSYADITNSLSKHESQYRDSRSYNALVRFNFDFSTTHQAQLKAYWQRESREHFNRSRVMAVAVDPVFAGLFERHPEEVLAITALARSESDFNANKDEILQLVGRFSPADQQSFDYLSKKMGEEKISGTFDYGYSERRADIEWQDTVIWHPRLRSVSGISMRHDQARSETFFGGTRSNDTYRAFANFEWRALDNFLVNLGGTYERDDLNNDALTPRLAFNFLLSPQQSIRLVYSEAVRSPDMVEQTPGMVVTLKDLSSNYLGLTEGQFYLTNVAGNKGLKHEKIRSYELGYYAALNNNNLEFDLKLYRDEMRNLISEDPTNIDEPQVSNGSMMNIKGAEAQLSWRFYKQGWLWLTAAYMDIDKHIVNTRNYCVETCLSPEKSGTLSWHHQGNGWSNTLSYLWLDGFANNQHLYQRSEWHLRKEWKLGRYTPWVGGFWQYQLSHQPLGYTTQRYSTRHIFYLQTGFNF